MNWPDRYKTTRGFAMARAIQRKGKTGDEPKTGKLYPLDNGHLLPLRNRKCKSCTGLGIVTPVNAAAALCGCVIAKALKTPGIELDELTGKLCIRAELGPEIDAAVERKKEFDAHLEHGRDEAAGSCACTATPNAETCASAGCGFCLAAEMRRQAPPAVPTPEPTP